MSNVPNSKFVADKVRITQILIRKAAIDNNTQLSELDANIYGFNVEIGFNTAVAISIKTLRVSFVCQIAVEKTGGGMEAINAHFEIDYFIEVSNLEEMINFETEDLADINDEGMMLSLANMIYATSRGIIYTRCQGTLLKSFILPVLASSTLLDLFKNHEEGPSHT